MKSSLPGLYIHFPFCASRCKYCDFYSVTDTGLTGRFIDTVLAEAAVYSGAFSRFDTLYIGGGTPSIAGPAEINRLVSGLRDLFEFDSGAEFTIEANPDDISSDLLDAYARAGFNRISVGVQSFDDNELATMGRRHDSAGARDALEMIRSAGFDRAAMDLIFGFAGQTEESWLETLETAAGYSPSHISCYQMTVAEGSPIELLSEDLQRDFFVLASDVLRGRGYVHYEVSNYALSAESRSKHNMKYWERTPVLGLGPSAHSFDGSRRWWNVSSLQNYSEKAVEEIEELSPGQIMLEELALGFRTDRGVPLDLIGRYERGEEVLGRLVSEGLVKTDKGRAVPTEEGFLFADRLPAEFI